MTNKPVMSMFPTCLKTVECHDRVCESGILRNYVALTISEFERFEMISNEQL